jgi:hypothetical protein
MPSARYFNLRVEETLSRHWIVLLGIDGRFLCRALSDHYFRHLPSYNLALIHAPNQLEKFADPSHLVTAP